MFEAMIGPPAAIALDGLSGTGKTTSGKQLCASLRRLGHPAVFHSTGWVWRLATMLVLDHGLDPKLVTSDEVIELVRRYGLSITDGATSGQVALMPGVDIDTNERTGPLYTPDQNTGVRYVAQLDDLRVYLNDHIIIPWVARQTAVVIIEGRDTVNILNGMWDRDELVNEPVRFIFEQVDPAEVARRGDREDVASIVRRDELDERNLSVDDEAIRVDTGTLDSPELALRYIRRQIAQRYPRLGNAAVITVVGPPGSGKGTHATRLAALMNGFYFSSGVEFRRRDEAGRFNDAELLRGGHLVESSTFLEVISDVLAPVPRDQIIVADGVARKIAEANPFLNFVEAMDRRPTVLVILESDEETMRRRNRRDRPDDAPNVQARRWNRYVEESQVSIDIMASYIRVVVRVDATREVKTIWDDIVTQLATQGLPVTA